MDDLERLTRLLAHQNAHAALSDFTNAVHACTVRDSHRRLVNALVSEDGGRRTLVEYGLKSAFDEFPP